MSVLPRCPPFGDCTYGSVSKIPKSTRRISDGTPVYESHSELFRELLLPEDASLRNRTSSQVSCDNTTVPNVGKLE
ncbi:unnamed protein product [Dicrocoelium dendriticum]|nr:unnamed protein product [Dicrocoelium dendriticum]